MQSEAYTHRPEKVLHLEVTQIGKQRLRTNLSSSATLNWDTLQTYDETHVCLQKVTHRSQQLLKTLNKANRNGRLSPNLLQILKECGQLLRDEFMSPKLKEKLNASDAHYLTISIDEHLVHVPWELLHDGSRFLCQRFAMGRLVQTRREFHTPCEYSHKNSLSTLILADLDGSLAAARREGMEIRDLMESVPRNLRVMMRNANVSVDLLKTKIRNYDWLHFAGHVDYDTDCPNNTGWRLSNGRFTAADAFKMAGTGALPKLIFANGCQSARTSPWPWDDTRQKRLFGLVRAFLFSGTRHYVGTSWEIPDQPARAFSLEFYRGLTDGDSVGNAVRKARNELIQSFGEEQIIWASYMLYGDPTFHYIAKYGEMRDALPPEAISTYSNIPTVNTTRAAENTDSGGTASPMPHRGRKRSMAVGLCAMMAAILAAVVFYLHGNVEHHGLQQKAVAAYQSGDFDRVLELCRPSSTGASTSVNCLLLRARVLFIQGDLENADALYRRVSDSSKATAMESSEALIGMGRIASTEGREQLAMSYYQQAADKAPKRKDPFLAMAILNERGGNDQDAMALLNIARKLSPPNDPSIEAMHRSLTARAMYTDEMKRIALVNKLIDDLSEFPSETLPASSRKERHPRPLPVWVMAMESSGYSLQEGAPELLTGMIEGHLQKNPALRIVDRQLMAMTLSEHKISASPLSDEHTRPKQGEIQAVRLMVNGRIIFSGPKTQVTLRCIDTETSRVVAVILTPFDNSLPLSDIARQVSDQLIQKINLIYP